MNSLGINKPPADTRVVVAMSGGVDSSVVAAMLHEEGYDVVGLTMQLYDHGEALKKKGACCAGQDIHDARRVAEAMGFPHYVLNYESRFKESVMDDFADSYLRGETPIPCVRCNQEVKFKDLLETARNLGGDVMATGHYVQRVETSHGHAMSKACDNNRDQSYFLFTTTRDQLNYLRFPLGGMQKPQVRELARKYNLAVSDKPDSQDICFVPSGGYASVIEKLRPGALDPGDIVHTDGRVMGRHNGIINYTIGQRRGIGVAAAEPLYVIKIDAALNRVYVGPKEELAVSSIFIRELNWLSPKSIDSVEQGDLLVKYRSTHDGVPATLEVVAENRAKIEFREPQYGISPGQAAVVYSNDIVVAGGWIEQR